MFRGFVWGILIAIVVALAGGYVVLRNGLIPANADASRVGSRPGRQTPRSMPPSIASPQRPNPVELTDANLIAGIELYREHCAFCHGTAQGEPSTTSVAKGE